MIAAGQRRNLLLGTVRVVVTALMVAIAAGAIYWAWLQHRAHPWTRDGQVLADVVHVAPRVAGPVLKVHVADNQRVARGDLLFELDPTLYEQAVKQAEADLAQAKAEAVEAAAESARATKLHALGDLSAQDFDLKLASQRSSAAVAEAAEVALATARLKLGYTRVTAPVDGFVTSLTLDTGTFAAAGEPQVALIDVDSFWIAAYFKETDLAHIRVGDPAAAVLMGYPALTITGSVESIAFGIAGRNQAPTSGDLPAVEPTFEWIRLAQRIPVRIRLEQVPEGLSLRVGLTASVTVNPSTPPPASAGAE